MKIGFSPALLALPPFVILIAGLLHADELPAELPPVSGFHAGIGFAGVAVAKGPGMIYMNPATIGIVNEIAVGFTGAARELESPGSWSFLIVNSSVQDGAKFGFGLIRRRLRREGDMFHSFSVITPLNYSFDSGRLPVGTTLKFTSERDDGGSWSYGYAMDLGMMLVASDQFNVGLCRYNWIGSALRSFAGETWLGASLGGGKSSFLATGQVQFDRPFDGEAMLKNYAVGAAFDLIPGSLELRAGYRSHDPNAWFTAGVGIVRGSAALVDYAYAVNPDTGGDQAHFVTYGYSMKASAMKKPKPNSYWDW